MFVWNPVDSMAGPLLPTSHVHLALPVAIFSLVLSSPADGEDPVLISNFEGAVVDRILNPLKREVICDRFGFDAFHV